MPITLAKTEVVKQYRLTDNTLLTVVAEQMDGPKARTYDEFIDSSISVPQRGTVEIHQKSPVFRSGVAAALCLKDCTLRDSDSGDKILKANQPVLDFLDVWYHPALGETALIDAESGTTFSYRDLVADAVYEVNPNIDPFPGQERPAAASGPDGGGRDAVKDQ